MVKSAQTESMNSAVSIYPRHRYILSKEMGYPTSIGWDYTLSDEFRAHVAQSMSDCTTAPVRGPGCSFSHEHSLYMNSRQAAIMFLCSQYHLRKLPRTRIHKLDNCESQESNGYESR